jgi:hypothetical protein
MFTSLLFVLLITVVLSDCDHDRCGNAQIPCTAPGNWLSFQFKHPDTGNQIWDGCKCEDLLSIEYYGCNVHGMYVQIPCEHQDGEAICG